jgi:hypothetical protein
VWREGIAPLLCSSFAQVVVLDDLRSSVRKAQAGEPSKNDTMCENMKIYTVQKQRHSIKKVFEKKRAKTGKKEKNGEKKGKAERAFAVNVSISNSELQQFELESTEKISKRKMKGGGGW